MNINHRYPVLINEENYILVLPKAGKPDPNIECNETNFDTRRRVKQPAQKGNTCWYYGLKILYEGVGKNPCQSLKERRSIELLVSNKRKAITQLDENLKHFKLMLKVAPIINSLTTRNEVKGVIDILPEVKKKFSVSNDNQSFDRVVDFLKIFVNQTLSDDLEEYVNFNLGKYEINRKFLDSLNVDFKDFYQTHFVNNSLYQKYAPEVTQSWKDLTPKLKSYFISIIAKQIIHKKFQFKESTWKPNQNIESLIEHIKAHGPHLISGLFGHRLYEKPPTLRKQETQYGIYAWSPTDKKLELNRFHLIALVGAQKLNKQEFVYYIDPNEESDPNFPEKRCVFKTSYKRILEGICNFDGIFASKDNSKLVFENTVYSIYL